MHSVWSITYHLASSGNQANAMNDAESGTTESISLGHFVSSPFGQKWYCILVEYERKLRWSSKLRKVIVLR